MFRPEDILARIKVQPFCPLRIIASEGLRYEIRHPDLVRISQRYLMIGHETPGVPGIYSGITYVALIHIVGIEEILVEPSATNGTAS